jgi:hypothetical protein
MKNIKLIFLFTSIIQIAKSQNHAIGVGSGISRFEPNIHINYQFNYKLLNTKFKASLLPFGLWTSTMSSSYDLYLGIKTPEDKRNIFSLNTGITLFNPRIATYETRIKQQVNPIINFEYAFAFNANHRITTDLSISQYSTYIPYKSGENYNTSVEYIIIEFGYSYRFKKRTKEEKNTN